MRTKRRELKELRQGRKCGLEGSSQQQRRRQLFAEGQLSRVESYYELLKMIAGAGMGLAGSGVGMLRTRRRDISIKPNRKLDRKSGRGMIYENEELRLRTIHINAEVEQGQNDIKKLRRENEQLRREIWSLRDEYDKLEEILKKQKSREESGEPEDRSENETTGSESEDDELDDEDEEEEDEESESEEDANENHDKEERLENAENQKISSEKLSNATLTPLRTRLNFEGLPVVKEEEEIKKDKENKPNSPTSDQHARGEQGHTHQSDYPVHARPFVQTEGLATTTGAPSSFVYQSDCPFAFPGGSARVAEAGYSNIMPLDGSCLLMTTCPQLRTPGVNQEPEILGPDLAGHNQSPLPPPAGWQNGVLTSGPVSNFATIAGMSACEAGPSKQPQTEDARFGDSSQSAGFASLGTLGQPSLAERRKAFFRTTSFNTARPRECVAAGEKVAPGSGEGARGSAQEGSIDDREATATTTLAECSRPDESASIDSGPRHFFAPLPGKSRLLCSEESGVESMDDGTTPRQNSDSGCSPSSEKSVSTVISRERYNCEKGSVDICVNGAIPCNGNSQIERRNPKGFFSSENFLIVTDTRNDSRKKGTNNLLMRSASYQDLNLNNPFKENIRTFSHTRELSKSDNQLNGMSSSSKVFKSQMSVGQRQSGIRNSQSPDTPEVSMLPSIDYKLFNNPFLQNFEQAYQNFPVRTDGQSPVTHPLSIQVCESPVSGASYSSPIKVQPTFSGPSVTEPDCGTCKHKDLERLRLMIPPSKFLNQNGEKQEFHVTSFETPSPHTVQIPPMTPYELESLRKMPIGTSPILQTPRLYQNVPFVPRGAAVYCPGQGVRMYYDTASMKVPAQTQTSLEDEITTTHATTEASTVAPEDNPPTTDKPKKRRSRKEKGSIKDKRRSPSSVRRKDLKKQISVSSHDVPESPGKFSAKTRSSDIHEDLKNESRSSSSGQESPKKEHTKRVSLYFSSKKRPSISSSIRTSRSRSVENAKERQLTRGEDAANSERERTNSISSREVGTKERTRKGSTSSGSVPWCACWGNGCI